MAGEEVFVTFDTVQRAADDARATAAALEQQLAELKSYLAPLVAGWQGQAAGDYRARQEQWDAAQSGLDQVLAQIGQALQLAHDNFTGAQRTNAAMWSGGQGGAAAGGVLRVSPSELQAAAPTFEAAGDAVARALSALQGSLPDAVAMCGDDDAGRAFLGTYRPRLAQIEQAVSAIVGGLPTVGTGLRTAAGNVSGADGSSVMSTGG